MLILIFMWCLLSLGSSISSAMHYNGYNPVTGLPSFPQETPEVYYAKAAHFAAHKEARERNHHFNPKNYHSLLGVLPVDTPEVARARTQHFKDYALAAQRNGVHIVTPLTHQFPVDTPEVQNAKAAHFAAHAAARSGLAHYRYRRQVAQFGPNGFLLETPEVQAAKALHLNAHLQARLGPHYGLLTASHNGRYSHYPHAEIGPDGHPVDTPEVQYAKQAHFAAHSAAKKSCYYC